MMPRSSRSHSTHMPAESMTASTPQVLSTRALPRHDREGARPRRAGRTRAVGRPTHRSSMPPVPKVALASPGRVHPWPDERRLLVAGDPADDRARRPARVGLSHGARGVDDVGKHAGGGCAARRAWCRPSPPRRASADPVTAGVGGVGDVQRTASTASRPPSVSTVPKHRSRLRSGSAMSRSMESLVADSLGATRMPWSRSTRHVPTVRRSCQPMPGPTGSPLTRSQTMVEPRWLAIPTPPTGPPAPSAAPATSSTAEAMASASNSTKPGAGDDGSTSDVVDVVDRPVGRRPRRHARPRSRRRRRGSCSGPPDLSEGRRQTELPRIEDAAGVEGPPSGSRARRSAGPRASAMNRPRLMPTP